MHVPRPIAARFLAGLRSVASPGHWPVLLRDGRGVVGPIRADADHLEAAMRWLMRAQDQGGRFTHPQAGEKGSAKSGGGVSAGYYMTDGWLPPYPETTGYIVPTFLAYADRTGCDEYRDRALRMGRWECAIQLPEGGVRGQIGVNAYPIVFNTGQVILGWCALYRATGEQVFLDAAVRAGDWLASVQDDDGAWTRHTHAGVPHAYHSRVAWPLLELAELAGTPAHRVSAERFLAWLLDQHEAPDWLRYMGFMPHQKPYTHTIAYTLRGLLECGRLLNSELGARGIAVARAMAGRLLRRFELAKDDPRGKPRMLPGAFDSQWRPAGAYSCLTGSAQLAIVWLQLFEASNDGRFVNAALKLIDQVKSTQRLNAWHPGIRGAVAGSYPTWGGYERLGYPNWATKFLADAIMVQERAMSRWEGDAS